MILDNLPPVARLRMHLKSLDDNFYITVVRKIEFFRSKHRYTFASTFQITKITKKNQGGNVIICIYHLNLLLEISVGERIKSYIESIEI